jgi:hypothetical protein
MELYMFRALPLSIIRSYSLYTQQCYMSYSFVDSFRAAGSGWICSSILILLECCLQTCTAFTIAERTVSFQNTNFEKLVHLVGFIIRKFIYLFLYGTFLSFIRPATGRGYKNVKEKSAIEEASPLQSTR